LSVAVDLMGLTIYLVDAFKDELTAHFLGLPCTILIQVAVVCTSLGPTLILRSQTIIGHNADERLSNVETGRERRSVKGAPKTDQSLLA
jgi:hypothetical protein